MSVIEDLRAFLSNCPFLSAGEFEGAKIYVDHTSETPTAYTIIPVPAEPYYKKYVDGGGIKQFVFVFRSVENYDGRDIALNTSNNKFYEDFSRWLEATRPEAPGWIKVEPLTGGYMFDMPESADRAAYQIQCRALYNN